MSDRLQVVVDDRVVTVSLKGKTSMMLSIEAVLRAVWMARTHGAKSVLFDIRESVSDDFHTRVVKLASEASRTGITTYRVAVLGNPGDPRLRFIEDVAHNRGIKAKCFTDHGEALVWLQEVADSSASDSKVA